MSNQSSSRYGSRSLQIFRMALVEFLAINCYETKWLDIVSRCLPSKSGSLGNQEIGLLVF